MQTVLRQGTGKSPFDEAMLVLQHHDKNRTTKARISSKFDISLSYKMPAVIFKDIATTTLGIHGSNLQNEKRNFKAGFQLELNV